MKSLQPSAPNTRNEACASRVSLAFESTGTSFTF
jgi:hypothetical protein